MPWNVAKRGEEYCCVNSDTGRVLKGGCHATKQEAQAHCSAVNINYARSKGVRIKTPRMKK